jgi:HSP20 family protein
MDWLTHWNESRWNQLKELEDLQHNLRGLFSRSRASWPERTVRVPQWVPVVDFSEDSRGYVLRAELPQVRREDVSINLEDGMLTITGDRRFDQNRKRDHRVEHTCGRFVHSFLIPEDAHPAKVSAVFKRGVLIVHMAKLWE